MTLDNKINPVCLKRLREQSKSVFAVYDDSVIKFFLEQKILFRSLLVNWEIYLK